MIFFGKAAAFPFFFVPLHYENTTDIPDLARRSRTLLHPFPSMIPPRRAAAARFARSNLQVSFFVPPPRRAARRARSLSMLTRAAAARAAR